MTEIALAAAGVVIGAAVAWIAVRARAPASAAERERLQARAASLEALEAELRRQLAQQERELTELRAALGTERELRAQADTRWEVARASLDEQRRLFDEARLRLAETFKVLSAEALEQSGAAFLERARDALDAQLGRREDAVQGLVRPSARGAGPLRGSDPEHGGHPAAGLRHLAGAAAHPGRGTRRSPARDGRARWPPCAPRTCAGDGAS